MGKKTIPTILFLVIFSLIFSVSRASAEIKINEIMYNPSQDENYNEWIEIYNSGNGEILLENFTLCGKEILPGYINRSGGINRDSGLLLEAESYALITDGGSGTDVYNNFNVSAQALALHVAASSLCAGLSNAGKTITLEKNGNTVSGVTYNDDAREGYSLELANGSFRESIDIGGTPGRINSEGSGTGSGNTSGNSTSSGGSSSGGGSSGKKNKNETKRVRSNLSDGVEAQRSIGKPQLNILEKPSSLKFGQVATIKASLLADGDYPQLLFFLYSEPKRVVRDFSGEQVTKSSRDASTTISARAYAGEEIEFSLPLKIVENCNK